MSRAAQHMSLFPVNYMVDEAITFLRQHEPPEGYFVGFSGGKDSIVTLELCRMAGVRHEAWYSCTRIDPPEVVKFIRQHYPDVQWAYPKMTFWEGIKKKSPPLRFQRWCCDVLKKDPTKDHPIKQRVMGMRIEESRKRAGRPRIDYFKRYKQTIYKPIFEWREWHVWDFIDLYSLPYPGLYDEGFDRLGCVICPFIMHKNQANINRARERWPGMFKTFEKVCREWFDTRMKDGFRENQKHHTFEEYIAAYYRGFE